MRIVFGALVAASLIGFAGAAYAADATGTIKTLDATKKVVTLDNGATYDIAKGVNLT